MLNTAKRDAEIARLYTQERLSLRELAALYGLSSPRSVQYALERQGVQTRRALGDRRRVDDTKLVATYLAAGTVAEASRRTGHTRKTVLEALRRCKTPRPRGKKRRPRERRTTATPAIPLYVLMRPTTHRPGTPERREIDRQRERAGVSPHALDAK